MINRPKCKIEGCNGNALLIVAGNTICGACYANYHRNIQKTKWSEIQNAATQK